MSTPGTRLGARYGARPARPRRRRLLVAAGAIVLAGIVVLVGLRYADQPVRAQSVAYEHAEAGGIDLTFQVTMLPGTRAVCAVQALDSSRGQVGFREVEVPPQKAAESIQHVSIATQGPPVSAEVMHCERG